MRSLRLSHLAQADIEAILLRSQMVFGAAARRRYEALLVQALKDIAADPDRIGVRRRDDLRPGWRTYHLFHSRTAVRGKAGAVQSPRHLVVFRVAEPDSVDVARILHDAMDLPAHMPGS